MKFNDSIAQVPVEPLKEPVVVEMATTGSFGNLVELYSEETSAPILHEEIAQKNQSPDPNDIGEAWIEGWTQKITMLLGKRDASHPKSNDPILIPTSNKVEPVLRRMGLSSDILDYIASLDEPEVAITSPTLPIKEIPMPAIPSIANGQESLIQALETKIKVLEEALSKSQSETQQRKSLENQVASVTSRIAMALEKMSAEKTFVIKEKTEALRLLEDSLKEKMTLRNQVQEVLKQKEEARAEAMELQNQLEKLKINHSKRSSISTSTLEAKVATLTTERDNALAECSELKNTVARIQSENSSLKQSTTTDKVPFRI